MQYNEIYNICQPIMDWLKSNYPHNHKIIVDTNGAELIECGKLVVLDKDLTPQTKISPMSGEEMLIKLSEYASVKPPKEMEE